MQDVHEILKVRGQVFPATTQPATLVAELSDGRVVRGESPAGPPEGRGADRAGTGWTPPSCPP